MKKVCCVVAFILFTGCFPTQLYISDTLPSSMQQLINSAATTDINYTFVPHENGDNVQVEAGPMWSASYSINEAFSGLMQDLLYSKFSQVTDSSENRLTVSITNINSYTQIAVAYRLKMAIRVDVERSGQDKFSRRFSYSTSVPIQGGFHNANAAFKKDVANAVKELLLKFVVSTDKYLDANKL